MAKLTSEWSNDIYGNEILKVEKKRGKITLDELEDYLRSNMRYLSNWAVILRCTESTMGGSGWNDDNENIGDTVLLYEIADKCPICGKEME